MSLGVLEVAKEKIIESQIETTSRRQISSLCRDK